MIWTNLLQIIVPPLFTFLAGFFGIKYGLKQIRFQKTIDVKEQQLQRLYSPLASIQKEIEAKSNIRKEISEAANTAWKEICEKHKDDMAWDHDREFEPFNRIIDYENKQLHADLLPLYNRMLDIFREHYWLADPDTRAWYQTLFRFVEIWNRWEEHAIPGRVIERIGHSEETLRPFYSHLHVKLDQIKNSIVEER